MAEPIRTTQINAKPAEKSFRLELMTFGNDKVHVRSCEVMQAKFAHTTSFSAETTLEDIFVTRLAQQIRRCLTVWPLSKDQSLSLPDLILEIPGLTLFGADVVITTTGEAKTSVVITFNVFIGGLFDAFNPGFGFEEIAYDRCGEISAAVLTDLALPILDLCDAAEKGLFDYSETLRTFGRELKNRSDEIRFQIELIKRYIDVVQSPEKISCAKTEDDKDVITLGLRQTAMAL
ncbi:hypothetical protein ACS3SW_01750 [Roseobacteraceae bacterium S113]